MPEIKDARTNDAEFLTELSMRSKAYWGYSPDFIEACRAELTLSENEIRKHVVRVAYIAEKPAGYYYLRKLSEEKFELEALFVEPSLVGSGIGTALFKDATSKAAVSGGKLILIQGDPNARQFYLNRGARLIGESPSGSIKNRMLPLFRVLVGGGVNA